MKIVFVVGHRRWGKSRTLRALTDGNVHQRWIVVRSKEFYIRRMSNDDRPEGYTEFMMALDRRRSFLIAALCPNFSKIRANGGNTAEILRSLGRKGYELFFWVMEHQYGGSETVTNKQISQLQKFGTVEVFTRQAEAPARTRALRKFVADALLT